MRLLSRFALLALAAFVVSGDTALAQQSFSRGYGAMPSDPDRVRTLTGTPEFRAYLPEVVDLSSYFPVPGDQGEQGSCTAWAVGYAARAYYAAAVEARRITSPQSIPSPAFIYNQIVGIPGDCASGSSNALALEVLKQGGSLSLADYPYNQASCDPPAPELIASASDFRIEEYRVVDHTRLDQVKGALADGHPVVFRIVPDAAFDNLWDKPKAVWHSPPLPEDSFGHAMTLVGYNEARQTFKFINSWGPAWSDNGYGRMDYQTFLNRTTEAFVMVLPTAAPEVPAEPAGPELAPEPEIVPEQPIEPADVAPKEKVDLGRLQCSRVDVATRGGKRIAEGFVGSAEDLATVQIALAGEVDSVEVDLAPWPQCEALLTLQAQLAETDVPKVTVPATELSAGDTLAISIETPDFDSYVHAAYVQADGNVVHLQQVDAEHLNTIAGHSVLQFGDGEQGRDRFEVAGPFGDEMLLVITSRSPLFSTPRPDVETEREFLSALREAILTRPDKGSAERFISAAYVPIRTLEATQ